MKKNIMLFAFVSIVFTSIVILQARAQNTSPFWSLAGNNNATGTSKLGTTNAVNLGFFTNNSEKLRITTSGLVGIGTTNPLTKFHVNGFGSFGNRVTTLNATRALNLADDNAVLRVLRVHPTSAPAVELISRTTADGANVAYWDFYAQPSDASFRIRDRKSGGAGLDRVTITSPFGNVGIGTTLPGYRLTVTNNTAPGASAVVQNLFNGPNYNDGLYIDAGDDAGTSALASYYIGFRTPNGTYIGSVTQNGGSSVSFNTTSDKRLKTNIRKTSFGLADVKKIQVMDYNFIGGKNEQTGFIAQQLYEIFPEAVSVGGEDPKTRPWMVDYGRITPLLVKAVQDLSGQSDAKEAAIATLQQQVNDLVAEVKSLKSLIVNAANAGNSNTASGYLKQNNPNPATNNTIISYYVPGITSQAQIVITDSRGSSIKVYNTLKGAGELNIKNGELPVGVYNYTLYANNKVIDSKQMVITK